VETYTFVVEVGYQPNLPILRPCMLWTVLSVSCTFEVHLWWSVACCRLQTCGNLEELKLWAGMWNCQA